MALVVNTFDDPNVTVKFDNLIVRGLNDGCYTRLTAG